MTCGKYDIIREGEEIILRVDCEDCPFFPSLEDEPRLMSMTIDMLTEAGKVTKIVYVQKRDIEYDETQVEILSELANLYKHLMKQKFAYGLLSTPQCERWVHPRYTAVQNLLHNTFKGDPVGAYVELHRLIREEKRQVESGAIPKQGVDCLVGYFKLV